MPAAVNVSGETFFQHAGSHVCVYAARTYGGSVEAVNEDMGAWCDASQRAPSARWVTWGVMPRVYPSLFAWHRYYNVLSIDYTSCGNATCKGIVS
jgi:hypothetical protein